MKKRHKFKGINRGKSLLYRRLMDILCCPQCKSDLLLSVGQESILSGQTPNMPMCKQYCALISKPLYSEEIKNHAYQLCSGCYGRNIITGSLFCANGHTFPIDNFIPRFVSSGHLNRRTMRTFDIEWQVFHYKEKIYGHSQKEELEDFFKRMVVDIDFLKSKTILDAGCGMGRLIQTISQKAREIIGIDFSKGVDEALKINKNSPTVHLVQGDLLQLPFKANSFDYVFSKGVLHYVSDPQKGIFQMGSVVKPEGALSFTLYPKMSPIFEKVNKLIRKMSAKLSLTFIFWLSYLLIPFLTFAWKLSGMSIRAIQWNERAHMIFNWFSSEYQNTASYDETTKWLDKIGFKNVRYSKIPIGVTGFKK